MNSDSRSEVDDTGRLPDSLVRPPAQLETLVEVCSWRAEQHPRRDAFLFLEDGDGQVAPLDFGELDRRAAALAGQLVQRGCRGERMLLVFEPGLDYITAILGCFYSGTIAVPVYPPDPYRLHRTLPRLQATVASAEAKFLLTSESLLGDPPGPLGHICPAGTLTIEALRGEWTGERPDLPPVGGAAVAMLQYTSGSTGTPRGVVVSHANLMHNFRAMHALFDVPDATVVHWLPPYHDMGLIGGILLPLHSGRRTVLMSPLAFMQQPLRWLKAIDRYRGTTTGAPNFGYELCVRKIRDEQCAGLDLSCLQAVVTGAERVRPETLQRFTEKFAPFGFRPEAFLPAFGLAEATLIVSGIERAEVPRVTAFAADALAAHRAVPAAAGEPAIRLVSCGKAAEDVRIAVVDPAEKREVNSGEVGEIWVASPGVGGGYWNSPDATRVVFDNQLGNQLDNQLGNHAGNPLQDSPQFMRTGDLGFVHDGELYITGRHKELIILAGRNYFPQDLEHTVEASHPAFKADGGAAFAVEVEEEERLVVVHEVQRPRRYDLQEVARAARLALADEFALVPHAILLIAAGSLPKTSSGKTRRRTCRQLFLAGELEPLASWPPHPGGSPAAPDAPGRPGARSGDSLDTPTQRLLAGIWREVLDVPDLGPQSNFFELGGQSLRATQLLTRVEAECRVRLSLRELFDHPSLEAFATLVEAAAAHPPPAIDRPGTLAAAVNAPSGGEPATRAAAVGDSSPGDSSPSPVVRELGAPRAPRDASPPPASWAQERFWLLDQLGGRRAEAHVPVVLTLRGPLDTARLKQALARLAQRHAMLRCVLEQRIAGNGEMHLVQRIAERVEPPLEMLDLRTSGPPAGPAPPATVPAETVPAETVPAETVPAQVQEWLDRWIRRPLPLDQLPLWRAAVVQTAEETFEVALVLHHAICDGWSIDLLLRDLAACYQSPAAVEATADKATAYADYARWQRGLLEGPQLAEELRYWQDRLAGIDQVLQLPRLPATARPGDAQAANTTAAQAGEVKAIRWSCSADDWRDLQVLAQTHQATPFMVLLAIYQTILARFTGQTRFAIGAVIGQRPRPALEEVVGCFVNTLALPVDWDPEQTFANHLSALRGTLLEDLQRATVPYEQVVEACRGENSPELAPLTQALFVYQAPQSTPEGLGELELLELRTELIGFAPFELALVAQQRLDTLEVAFVFDPGQLEASVIGEMGKAFQEIARQVLASADAPLRGLLPSKLQLRQFANWNDTQRDVPDLRVDQLITRRGQTCPERVAIVFGDRQWSYRELLARMREYSEQLRQLGIGPGKRVGVLLERSPELIALLLAILERGGSYVPLDPSHPPQRTRGVIADARLALLLVDDAAAAGVADSPDSPAQVLDLNSLATAAEAELPLPKGAGEQPAAEASPPENAPAYVIYTSGSTGKPKGVVVGHRALANFLLSMADCPGLPENSRVLAETTVAFDIAAWELFLPLVQGATVVLADSETARDADQLARLIDARAVTAIQGTPSTYRFLLATGWRPQPHQTLLCGGEPLDYELAHALRTSGELWNVYGPTETTVWSTRERVAPDALSRDSRRPARGIVPIGRPLANTQCYVVDTFGALAPVGVAGELYLGGLGLAEGYWDRAELTAERFVSPAAVLAAPFPLPADARWYRTGDFARWLPDGRLEFLGRGDNQVKIRGFRVELAEIEAALVQHPAVAEAVVVPSGGADAGPQQALIAHLGINADSRDRRPLGNGNGNPHPPSPTPTDLREFLAGMLPDYMIPTGFQLHAQLPRNPAGKLDRRQLANRAAQLSRSSTYREPRSPLERQIAEIWHELLRVPQVGLGENFFELGGHSLTATQFFARLNPQVGLTLPLRMLYDYPTIDGLASRIVQLQLERHPERVEELLQDLEQLSDEEVARLLGGGP